MKITVNKDNVKIEEFDVVHEGEHRVNKCSFSFSEEYTEELVKKAIFTSQNSSVEVAIINNECNIPTEILRARNIVLLGVYAYKVVDDKLDLRYSPSPDAFKVNSGSYIEGANESEEITPSQFEQYMQAMNDGLNKVEESIKKMDEATSSANDLVDNINQKLENGDFIGPEGQEGPQGVSGTNGKDGVGITTITSGQSTVEEDKTITPITVNKTDGSSQIFKVEAKNGIDGQNGQNGKDGVNGQDGLTPTIGENGNWFLGDTDTGKPSRGEVGPSPDLSNYVKNTDYATNNKTGVINGNINGFQVSSSGKPYAKEYTAEEYDNVGNQDFIGKGTLENAKDKIVGSSQPVQDLTATVTNVQNDQDEGMPKQNTEGTDNTITDALDMNLFALGGDGKSEQVTTTGKNLLPNNITSQIINGVTVTKNDDGSITLNGTATSYFTLKFTDDPIILQPGTYMQSFHPSGSATPTGGIFIRSKDSDDNQIFEYSIVSTISKTLDVETTIVDYSVAVNVGTVIKNITLYPMLELGSTATSYEPYTGGQPSPSPDYPQEINSIEGSVEFACRGKNILTKKSSTQTSNGITNVFKDNTLTYNGTASRNYSNCVPTGNFKITKGTYTFSITNPLDTSISVRFQKTIDYNGGSFEAIINKGETSVTFTLHDDFNFLYFYLVTREGDTYSGHTSMQLEKGTQATEYEPHVEPNQVTFNLNDEKLRSVGDVKDELIVDLDTGDYYKVENIGKVVLDGSDDENWKYDNKEGDITQWRLYLGDSFYRNDGVIRIISNYFLGYGFKDSWYIDNSVCLVGENSMRINTAKFDSVESLKEWLSTHNTIVDYVLQTPTTKKLGTLSSEDLAKLKTFKGYNNVTVNTNLGLMNIRFTYGLDIKKYVDNKIAQLSEQLIKGE